MEIKQAKVEETYRHKKTGEVFKERKDWEAKGYTCLLYTSPSPRDS